MALILLLIVEKDVAKIIGKEYPIYCDFLLSDLFSSSVNKLLIKSIRIYDHRLKGMGVLVVVLGGKKSNLVSLRV